MFGQRWFCFGLTIILGLLAGFITAVVAALVFAEAVALLKMGLRCISSRRAIRRPCRFGRARFTKKVRITAIMFPQANAAMRSSCKHEQGRPIGWSDIVRRLRSLIP